MPPLYYIFCVVMALLWIFFAGSYIVVKRKKNKVAKYLVPMFINALLLYIVSFVVTYCMIAMTVSTAYAIQSVFIILITLGILFGINFAIYKLYYKRKNVMPAKEYCFTVLYGLLLVITYIIQINVF